MIDGKIQYPDAKPFTDRHGKTRWRYRKKGRDISLPEAPGTPAFDAAYQDAIIAAQSGRRMRRKIRRTGVNPNGVRGNFPSCIDRVLKRTQMRARSFDREFELDRDWMIDKLEEQDYRCALTKIPFCPSGARNPLAPSIDRIDNKGGYTVGNVRLVLLSVNLALNDFGKDHFDMICAARAAAISRGAE